MAKDFDEFKQRYKDRLKKELGEQEEITQPISSRQYEEFKKELMPKHYSLYEKACNFSEKILKLSPDKKTLPDLQEALETCHLNITPSGAASFAILGPLLFIVFGSVFALGISTALLGAPSMFFVLFIVLTGVVLIIPLQKLPYFLASNWRMRASNQMVLCVFYIVTYMRHTSNLELAVKFAAEHLDPPLALDLKKVVWDIETERFDSIKESLDNYLLGWRKYSMEFVESMHLIESSLYESSESRRVELLEKALTVMLNETYEKMLHYAHNLKGPIQTLHMLGIILPILGLVILPLVVSFMPEVKWYHLFMLYNIILPVAVYYLAKVILSKRPSGYGESDISENPEIKKYKNILLTFGKSEVKISPAFFAATLFILFFLIGLTPLLIHASNPHFDLVITNEGVKTISSLTDPKAKFYFLGYRPEIVESIDTGNIVGPYGLGAAILSLFITLSFGLSLGLYYKLSSQNIIKIREEAVKLEQEFASALFQLGNRLGDGLPAEIAFQKVADVMRDTVSGNFFLMVSNNISKLGMGVEQAIFDPEKGALVYYPSSLIESSMKVLTNSLKKGPIIAGQAVINISEYITQMHRVDERLKDLMADTISSMKSQISFLTPAIAGIVIGITSMIIKIIGTLQGSISSLTEGVGGGVQGAALLSMFGSGIPTYFFQIIVGLYVVQIVFILSVLINGIQNGASKLSEKYLLGKNLVRSTTIYVAIGLIIMLLFNLVAGAIISSGAIGTSM
jgi:hypothetical protein